MESWGGRPAAVSGQKSLTQHIGHVGNRTEGASCSIDDLLTPRDRWGQTMCRVRRGARGSSLPSTMKRLVFPNIQPRRLFHLLCLLVRFEFLDLD